ncbi:hypothetical protein MPTK1_7g02470 [Marchantia polymorpha subsp. ruderalis]|uniref:Uncharacterized protein n=2 Tax=Marchantia polymorpha TaxID=3197 RepID=A0AAF6BVE3_MARPO|nr:hypothetical protein MARPO_0088s0039 [Marchantia polymorpha]BBN15977.1 hypothetical protein Mp_7g02470 [Marchantia polymorpha subsp. ruderalis]|eukprot:PTQ33493.1 hypothetical protein MARPO_0088s0039 [Marchantia polymorpha]
MARTLERSKSVVQLQDVRSVYSQTHQQQPDEVVCVTLAPRPKSRVTWQPTVVDNEFLGKKCYEKEFFFNQDIWG